MPGFNLDEYLNTKENRVREEERALISVKKELLVFENVCEKIKEEFLREWQEDRCDLTKALELQKKAIIGYPTETGYFKDKIKLLIKKYNLEDTIYPFWHESLVEAIYHENWGLSGIAEWFGEEYKESSSAKIIGERIYFMKGGKINLMPQTISSKRRKQLIRAFLLFTPDERLDKDFHELYLLDGTRITVFGGKMVKDNQDIIIFRRYVVPEYTFKEQADRGTIPGEAIPLFEDMVKAGYNVAFTGAVRSAKTTFLSTWQSREDQSLEGVMVETDPEIPMHHLMPKAPIVQLLADKEGLEKIMKNLLRSDADYFILAEARDGLALDTAIRIASKGTRRMKLTFHLLEPLDFTSDVAWEISRSVGGDPNLIANRVATAFDFLFHFIQLKDKSKKRLSCIYEISFNRKLKEIAMNRICKYEMKTDTWIWENNISDEKLEMGESEDIGIGSSIREKIKNLIEKQKEEKLWE